MVCRLNKYINRLWIQSTLQALYVGSTLKWSSERRHDVISTTFQRCSNVRCPLGKLNQSLGDILELNLFSKFFLIQIWIISWSGCLMYKIYSNLSGYIETDRHCPLEKNSRPIIGTRSIAKHSLKFMQLDTDSIRSSFVHPNCVFDSLLGLDYIIRKYLKWIVIF